MEKVRVTELGYIGLGVSDLGAWRAFAADVLGMEVLSEPGGARVRMDYWHQRIVLHEGGDDDLAYAGFRVAGPEEFSAMQQQLAEQGVAFTVASAAEAAERHVLELMKMQDPAGLPVEVFHGPRVDSHAPPRPGRGMHGRFCTGASGMGHIVIRDAGLEASERFYRNGLGMRGSIEVRTNWGGHAMSIMFMHCNPREHTVAFGVPNVTKRIQHFMVEVDNIDDVGLARDLATEAKVPILMGLGRHANDQMVSFYMQTPSGFFCEYGTGGRSSLAQSEYNVHGDTWGHKLLNPALLG